MEGKIPKSVCCFKIYLHKCLRTTKKHLITINKSIFSIKLSQNLPSWPVGQQRDFGSSLEMVVRSTTKLSKVANNSRQAALSFQYPRLPPRFQRSFYIFYGNVVPAMWCRQCLSLIVIQLKGKHCPKPQWGCRYVRALWL